MWKYRGRSAYRSENRFTAKLASFERLEHRCVLNAGPTSKAYDDPFLLDGKFDGNLAVVGNPPSKNHAGSNPAGQFGDKFHGQDPMLLGSRVVSSLNSNSIPSAEYMSAVGSFLSISPLNTSVMIVVTSLTSEGAQSFYAVTAYAVPMFDNSGFPTDNSRGDTPKGNGGGVSHSPTVPVISPSAVPTQSPELVPHPAPVGLESANVAAAAAQPPVAKMPIVAVVNQAVADTVHNTGFWYDSGVGQLANTTIVNDASLMQNPFGANFSAAGTIELAAGSHKSAIVKVSPADVSNWPVNKASLVSLPLNTKGVQQALEKVMGELGRLGTAFGTWLDAQHLTAAAAVVTVVTIGGGTAVYLRRRGGKHAQKREEEEASSSWLFAHLQSAPDVS